MHHFPILFRHVAKCLTEAYCYAIEIPHPNDNGRLSLVANAARNVL